MNRYIRALLGHMRAKPDAPFCRQLGHHGARTLLWRDLEADCGAFQAAYRAAGMKPGDQALIFLRHVPQLYGAFFGAMLGGFTPAFMPCTSPRQDPLLYWSSHRTLLDTIRPAAIVTDRATLDEMAASGLSLGGSAAILIEDLAPAPLDPVEPEEEAIGLLQHSSGTTGLKKGVALGYRAIVDQIESYAAALAITPADRIVSWLPLYHDMGLIACMILPAYLGLPVTHIDPFHWLARPGTLFAEIAAERGTLCWLPNFAFEHLAAIEKHHAAEHDLSSVRAFINCSEPCKPASFDRFVEAFAAAGVRAEQLQCCYAMAETVFAVSQTALGAPPLRVTVDPATLERGMVPRPAGRGVTLIETGAPIEGIEVTIHAPDRSLVPEGAVGEIAMRGRFLFSGYNRQPGKTAERFEGDRYFSNDLGFLRDGRLFVLGRIDDLVIVNGRNLYAHEVEAELTRIEGLKPGRAVAVAAYDARVGSETLVILAEKRAGADRPDRDIRREIIATIQSIFEVAPRAVELMEEGMLIKTTSGKISRSENLKRYLARGTATA